VTAVIVLCVGLLALSLGWWIRPQPARSILDGPEAPDATTSGSVSDLAALVARELRGGRSLGDALAVSARRHAHAAPALVASLTSGSTPRAAIDGAITAARSPVDALVLRGLQLAHLTGGPMADTIDRVLERARDRAAFDAERRAHAAQARLSALVLTCLPVVVFGWSALTSERTRAALTGTPAVQWRVGIGLAWNAVGWWWIRTTMRRAAR
jgi:Flp pilus assembly protein TadB